MSKCIYPISYVKDPIYNETWDRKFHEDLNAAAKLVYEFDGYYDTLETNGKLPPHAIDKIYNEGASFLSSWEYNLYSHLVDPEHLGIRNLHFTKKPLFTAMMTQMLPKYHPWRDSLTQMQAQLIAMGFVEKFMLDPLPASALPDFQAKPEESSFVKVHIIQFFSPLITSALCYAAAFAIFITEHFMYKSRKVQEKVVTTLKSELNTLAVEWASRRNSLVSLSTRSLRRKSATNVEQIRTDIREMVKESEDVRAKWKLVKGEEAQMQVKVTKEVLVILPLDD